MVNGVTAASMTRPMLSLQGKIQNNSGNLSDQPEKSAEPVSISECLPHTARLNNFFTIFLFWLGNCCRGGSRHVSGALKVL
jgi:hypothetical protein